MTTDTTHIDQLLYPKLPIGNIGNWQGRHLAAVMSPRGAEKPFVAMLKGWLEYADTHANRNEGSIGEDYVLGPEWETIGRSLVSLLNGETGRLDCGTLDSLIRSSLVAEGFSEEA